MINVSAGILYFGATSVLNMYVVHDLNNFDAYTVCTVHELDLVVVRHKRTQYICAVGIAHNMICAYIDRVLLASIS